MIALVRDIGIGVGQLMEMAESIKRRFSLDVVPFLEAFQPSLSSFNFEGECYDKKRLVREAVRDFGLTSPIIVLIHKIKTCGLDDSFCDLEMRACVSKKIDENELKKLMFLLL